MKTLYAVTLFFLPLNLLAHPGHETSVPLSILGMILMASPILAALPLLARVRKDRRRK